jgi:hypothetical protein
MAFDYDPGIILINGRYMNAGNLYAINKHELSIHVEYFSGEKELFQFGSKQEMDKALQKIEQAQLTLDQGY